MIKQYGFSSTENNTPILSTDENKMTTGPLQLYHLSLALAPQVISYLKQGNSIQLAP